MPGPGRHDTTACYNLLFRHTPDNGAQPLENISNNKS